MGLHDIELRAPFAYPCNRYDHEAFVFESNLSYSYVQRIALIDVPGELYVGGQLGWNLNNQLYETWDDSHLYWLNTYELGPVARFSALT